MKLDDQEHWKVGLIKEIIDALHHEKYIYLEKKEQCWSTYYVLEESLLCSWFSPSRLPVWGWFPQPIFLYYYRTCLSF